MKGEGDDVRRLNLRDTGDGTMENKKYTMAQAAQELGLTYSKMWRWIAEGTVKAESCMGKKYLTAKQLEDARAVVRLRELLGN